MSKEKANTLGRAVSWPFQPVRNNPPEFNHKQRGKKYVDGKKLETREKIQIHKISSQSKLTCANLRPH
jgi:hypothetical protein